MKTVFLLLGLLAAVQGIRLRTAMMQANNSMSSQPAPAPGNGSAPPPALNITPAEATTKVKSMMHSFGVSHPQYANLTAEFLANCKNWPGGPVLVAKHFAGQHPNVVAQFMAINPDFDMYLRIANQDWTGGDSWRTRLLGGFRWFAGQNGVVLLPGWEAKVPQLPAGFVLPWDWIKNIPKPPYTSNSPPEGWQKGICHMIGLPCGNGSQGQPGNGSASLPPINTLNLTPAEATAKVKLAMHLFGVKYPQYAHLTAGFVANCSTWPGGPILVAKVFSDQHPNVTAKFMNDYPEFMMYLHIAQQNWTGGDSQRTRLIGGLKWFANKNGVVLSPGWEALVPQLPAGFVLPWDWITKMPHPPHAGYTPPVGWQQGICHIIGLPCPGASSSPPSSVI